MIASLRGDILTTGSNFVVIESAGVGYQVLVTPRTIASLPRGEEAFLLTTLVVRDDTMQLYGFGNGEEREMFDLLQTVSGLGPKLALASLGALTPGEISVAVTDSDAKRLQTIPGVGKRMAEKIIVELNGKVADYLTDVAAPEENVSLPAAASGVADQVVEALIGLGFQERVARPVVEGVLAEAPDLDISAALRVALSQLGRT